MPRKKLTEEEEIARVKAMYEYEHNCRDNGYTVVAGVDEAGRGPLAGPVYAAASILAKVSRDRFICQMAEKYPEYGFEKHKGYGTKAHNEAILKYGPCPIHRRTFLRKLLGE